MEVRDLIPFALTLIVTGIIIAFGLQVQGDVKEDFVTGVAGCNDTVTTSCGLEYNATVSAQEGVSNLADKMPTIGLIGAIVVVISLLIGGFAYLMK